MNLTEPATLPYVSILIAARNEEHTILNCLQSIERLTYPKTHLEVWIGDDASTDQTYPVVQAFIKDKPYFHLVKITQTLGQAKAKANVLAQLAQLSTGVFLFITDADITLPPGWIEVMLDARPLHVGIVTGVTVPQATSLWTGLQALEWVYVIWIMWQMSKKDKHATAIGNNMMVTRQAYTATGGYEQIPFSITEDYALFRALLDKGYGFAQLYTPAALALTQPMPTLLGWLRQRKRWMQGVLSEPRRIRYILLLHFLFSLFLVYMTVTQPLWGGLLWLLPSLVQFYIVFQGSRILQLPHLRKYIPLFPIYAHVFTVLSMCYYLLPTGTLWKDRKY